jgi:hypothetical protein
MNVNGFMGLTPSIQVHNPSTNGNGDDWRAVRHTKFRQYIFTCPCAVSSAQADHFALAGRQGRIQHPIREPLCNLRW